MVADKALIIRRMRMMTLHVPQRFTIVLLLLVSITKQCSYAFSTRNNEPLRRSPTTLPGALDTLPTKESASSLIANNNINNNDSRMETWYKQNGIIHPNVQLQTTAKSIGGRGLFWNNQNQFARQGDLLAFIPRHLILEPRNIHDTGVKFASDLNDLSSTNLSWATLLTLYVYKAFKDDDCTDNVWKEWIQLWKGGGPEGPKPLDRYSKKEFESIQSQIFNGDQEIKETDSIDQVKEVIEKRYNTYLRDLNSVHQYFNIDDEELFRWLYSIVLSRTAGLGSTWQNRRGIIPLHDMINHPPNDGSLRKNVELFCVADVKDMIGDDGFSFLFSNLVKADDDEVSEVGYSDQDVLLVASANIKFGDELFLSYRNVDEKVETNHQIWLQLQYGFPFW